VTSAAVLRTDAVPYPRVLVSVLNYKSVDDAVATVRSLQNQDYPNFHLQLVDNASPNDCVAEIRRQVPDVDIQVSRENLGYCGGNNHALHQALAEGYDYVIVCNEDIEVAPETVRYLVETAEAHPDAGVVGAVEVNHFTDKVRVVRGMGFSFWRSRPRWSDDLSIGDTALNASYVQGALVLFTRRALQAGVLMNEDLFIYYDEADIGFQLARARLRAYVDPRVRVRHKNHVKYFNPRSGYLHQRNRVYLVHRYGKWYHRAVFHLGMVLAELPAKVIVRVAQRRARFAWACLLGYVDGVAGRTGPGRVNRL
jgi:GT2 family glycosyltransferase